MCQLTTLMMSLLLVLLVRGRLCMTVSATFILLKLNRTKYHLVLLITLLSSIDRCCFYRTLQLWAFNATHHTLATNRLIHTRSLNISCFQQTWLVCIVLILIPACATNLTLWSCKIISSRIGWLQLFVGTVAFTASKVVVHIGWYITHSKWVQSLLRSLNSLTATTNSTNSTNTTPSLQHIIVIVQLCHRWKFCIVTRIILTISLFRSPNGHIIFHTTISIIKRARIPKITMILMLWLILILESTLQKLKSLINLCFINAKSSRGSWWLAHIPNLLNPLLRPNTNWLRIITCNRARSQRYRLTHITSCIIAKQRRLINTNKIILRHHASTW